MIVRKIESQRYIPTNFGRSELFKTTIPEPIICNSARFIMKNTKIHYIDDCLFRILDSMNPFITKYPKIGNKIVNVFEKIVRFNNKLCKVKIL